MMNENRSVYAPILRHVQIQPDAPAVLLPRRTISFADLHQIVVSTRQVLQQQGLMRGHRVGVSVAAPFGHLVISLALAQLGVAHVSLPLTDPVVQRQQIAKHLALAAIVGSESVDELPLVSLQHKQHRGHQLARPTVTPVSKYEAPWLIVRSSGTTGDPKFGELTNHHSLVLWERFQAIFRLSAKDVMWPLSSVDFTVAKQRAVFALQAGAAVCLPAGLSSFGAQLEFARHSQVTYASATPAHLEVILREYGEFRGLPDLRVFEASGATASEDLRHRFRACFGDVLHVLYGTNEAGPISVATPAMQAQHADTVGRVAPGLIAQIVDNNGSPVPFGETGRLRVRGRGIIDRYIGAQEATLKSFQNGWFYPGDLAELSADGLLKLQGRIDDLMICDGVNIYPAEIERVLVSHPSVLEAAAFPLQSAVHQDLPAAAVVLSAPASDADILNYSRSILGFKAPRKIWILDELPRNPTGKVLKRSLRKLHTM